MLKGIGLYLKLDYRARRLSTASNRAPSTKCPTRRAAASADRSLARCPGQARQAHALVALGVEIAGIEPPLEGGFDRRPLAVDNRKPGGVAIAALDDVRLPEQPLKAKAVPRGGGARRRVERIALPFIAPVAELVENPPHHQVHRLRCGGRSLQCRRIGDGADLDAARRGVDV